MSGHDWRPLTATGALRAQWALLTVLVATFAAVGLSIGYTARSVQRSDRQWCELLRSLDQPLPSATPVTDRQRTIARQIHQIRMGKGCQ